MKKIALKIGLIVTFLLSFSYAEQMTITTVNGVPKVIKSGQVKLIDIAGKQRMLSQRIAKDYLYKGKKIAVSKADKQLKISLGEFSTAQTKLSSSINDPEIQNLLTFVQLSFDEFKELINQPFNLDNAQLALDLSESILEGSQYIVDSLKTTSGQKERPLSQWAVS